MAALVAMRRTRRCPIVVRQRHRLPDAYMGDSVLPCDLTLFSTTITSPLVLVDNYSVSLRIVFVRPFVRL